VGAASLGMALVQIALLDLVFSLDSVITAVGMVERSLTAQNNCYILPFLPFFHLLAGARPV